MFEDAKYTHLVTHRHFTGIRDLQGDEQIRSSAYYLQPVPCGLLTIASGLDRHSIRVFSFISTSVVSYT